VQNLWCIIARSIIHARGGGLNQRIRGKTAHGLEGISLEGIFQDVDQGDEARVLHREVELTG